ncbi:MAG: hypothetical protein ABFR95_09920 [Actinomycetota bacterium]
MDAILDVDLLVKQIALAFGMAMLIGNGFAIIQNHRGKAPKGEEGEFRTVRAWWLLAVGTLIAVWGAVSLFS